MVRGTGRSLNAIVNVSLYDNPLATRVLMPLFAAQQ